MVPTLNEEKIKKALDEKKAFLLAKKVFKLIAQKKAQMPPKLYLNLPAGKVSNDFRAMPAFIDEKGEGVCGIKWVSVFPENRRQGLPTVHATILLNSSKTGALLAIFEANHITAVRTGAAAAVATAFMANPRPAKLAIVGAGLQAEYQLRALASQFSFDEIGVWGLLPKEAETFCARFHSQFPRLHPFRQVRKCVQEADVIVTCTPSRKPIVEKDWIKKGAHINAIGADAKGKEELDPKLLKSSRVVVDEWEQASHSGEINVPISRGIISKRDVYAELSEVVSGRKKGRASREEITIFDSTGLAVLDIYFAKYIYDHYFG